MQQFRFHLTENEEELAWLRMDALERDRFLSRCTEVLLETSSKICEMQQFTDRLQKENFECYRLMAEKDARILALTSATETMEARLKSTDEIYVLFYISHLAFSITFAIQIAELQRKVYFLES